MLASLVLVLVIAVMGIGLLVLANTIKSLQEVIESKNQTITMYRDMLRERGVEL